RADQGLRGSGRADVGGGRRVDAHRRPHPPGTHRTADRDRRPGPRHRRPALGKCAHAASTRPTQPRRHWLTRTFASNVRRAHLREFAMADVWATIAAERGTLADDLADLTPAQWDTSSLCAGW